MGDMRRDEASDDELVEADEASASEAVTSGFLPLEPIDDDDDAVTAPEDFIVLL